MKARPKTHFERWDRELRQSLLDEARAMGEPPAGSLEAIVELMGSYLDGGHPFPQRTHLSVLFATFQIDVFKAMERWIEFARDEIDAWPSTRDLGMTPRTEELTRLLAQDRTPLNDRPAGEAGGS